MIAEDDFDFDLHTTQNALNASLEEEFICSCCFEMMVMPTTLNCGHSFCRPCLAKWFKVGKKSECPTCRQVFSGQPAVNISLKGTIQRLFPAKYAERMETINNDPETQACIKEFDKVILERLSDDNFTTACGGCVVGIGLTLIIIAVIMAFTWKSSESDLLVRKPVEKWSNDDVLLWLTDLGLERYHQKFIDNRVNGRMLEEIKIDHLESLFGMNNTLHQQTFIGALNYTLKNSIKWPANLWEYKALYPDYTTFLLFAMGHTPRLAIAYLYMYDYEAFELFYTKHNGCDEEIDPELQLTWRFCASVLFFPHFVISNVVYCYIDMHFWTCIILYIQCLGKAVGDFFYSVRVARSGDISRSIQNLVSDGLVMMAFYQFASWCWWLVPRILQDAFFYLEIYFGAFYIVKERFQQAL